MDTTADRRDGLTGEAEKLRRQVLSPWGFRHYLLAKLPLLGKDSSRLICAISAESEKGGDALLRNINTARSYHAMGQSAWYSDEVMDEMAALKKGPYAEPAQSPLLK